MRDRGRHSERGGGGNPELRLLGRLAVAATVVTGGVAEDSASEGTAHERGSLRLVVARAPEIDRSQRISAVYSQLVGRVGSDFTSFSLSAPEFAMPIWLSDGGKIIFAARFCTSCWNDFQRNFERSRKPRANGHPCNGQNKAPKLSACLFRHPAPATIPSFPPSLSPSGRNTCRSAGRTGMNLPPTLPPRTAAVVPQKAKRNQETRNVEHYGPTPAAKPMSNRGWLIRRMGSP